MSARELANADEETKAELRRVEATEGVQKHFQKFNWSAEPGMHVRLDPNKAALMHMIREEIYKGLPDWSDPIPTPDDWIEGNPHKNNKASASGDLWKVLRAWGSKKMHYFTRLKHDLAGNEDKYLFLKCFPDTNPASGGLQGCQPLNEENRRNLFAAYRMRGPMDLVKHILTLHEGEVRQVGEEQWTPFPASGELLHPNFWSYQFMTQDGAPLKRHASYMNARTIGNTFLADRISF